jgi:hypothetical protein
MSKKRKRSADGDETVVLEEPAGQDPSDAVETTDVTSKELSAEEKGAVHKKIHHSIKEAGRAFKKARDFEIRKIIKRIKAAEFTLMYLS